MKRTMRYLLPALALLATVSCATYNGAAMQSVGDVAVISIQCSRLVETGGDTEWGGVSKAWMRSEKFDLVPAAERIRSDLFGAYARLLPFTIVEERQVLDSEAYQGLGSGVIKLLPAREVALPTGYLPISGDSPRSIKEVIARFPEVNGFLWAEVSYTMVRKTAFYGASLASFRADLTVSIIDRKGRGMLRHTETAEDEVGMKFTSIGSLPIPDVVSAADRATARVSARMARWLEDRSVR